LTYCREEKRKLEEKELLVDKAPIISAATTPILEDTALRISTEKLEKVEKVLCDIIVANCCLTNHLITGKRRRPTNQRHSNH